MTPPFAAILRAAAWLFGDDTSARVFAPFVADWDHEQRHAATSWRRGLIAARWTLALVTTAACMSWRHTSPGWRAARAMAGFFILGTVILIAPFFRHLPSGRPHVLQLIGFLTPQAVGLALPFALLPAAILLGTAATPELQAKAAIALAWPIGLAILGWRIGRRRLGNSMWSMAAWWIFAAALIAVVDGWRHVARELPMALAPVLWLATSALLRPRDRDVTRTSETR